MDAGVDKQSVIDVGVDFPEIDILSETVLQGLKKNPISRTVVKDPAGGRS